jgi:hypothetical protein
MGMQEIESGSQQNDPIVWGAENIGRVINRNKRQAFYLLESGQLPAKKVGGRWAASVSALRAHFSGEKAN